MEKNFNQNDDFEQYLIDEVEGHKMYPSEHIWENIRTQLHGNPSWPALTFIAIAIILTLTVSTVFNYPPKTIITKTNIIVLKQGNNIEKLAAASDEIIVQEKTETLEQQINLNNYTKETIAAINDNNNLDAEDLIVVDKKTSSVEIVTQNKPSLNYSSSHTEPVLKTSLLVDNSLLVDEFNYTNQNLISSDISASPTTKKSKYQNLSDKSSIQSDLNNTDSYLNEFTFETKKPSKKQSGFELQFYATPSISYRKLEEDNTRLTYAPTTAMAVSTQGTTANVNNSVRHTPALGMELGAGILYNLTNNFKVKTGLQFNIRQYYIDATVTSYGMATIAFVQNNHLDSVSIASMFGNSTGTNGYYSTKLDNKLYQISIPIGFQWDFLQGKKLGLSASASIQPTFTLNKNVYMISTDYKYYANGAPFFRKWNFNSSLEFNLTYKTGNVKWYLGPQIRYQHLPTYNDVYPIKEYRLDYGFKVGIATPLFK